MDKQPNKKADQELVRAIQLLNKRLERLERKLESCRKEEDMMERFLEKYLERQERYEKWTFVLELVTRMSRPPRFR